MTISLMRPDCFRMLLQACKLFQSSKSASSDAFHAATILHIIRFSGLTICDKVGRTHPEEYTYCAVQGTTHSGEAVAGDVSSTLEPQDRYQHIVHAS